jgi:hypothetical protein
MKKIYKRPEMKVIECITTHLMDSSTQTMNLYQGNKANKDTKALSREWDTWDDD